MERQAVADGFTFWIDGKKKLYGGIRHCFGYGFEKTNLGDAEFFVPHNNAKRIECESFYPLEKIDNPWKRDDKEKLARLREQYKGFGTLALQGSLAQLVQEGAELQRLFYYDNPSDDAKLFFGALNLDFLGSGYAVPVGHALQRCEKRLQFTGVNVNTLDHFLGERRAA